MIVGSLNYKGLEIDCLHPILKKAIKYIEETNFADLENGTYQIEGDKIFAVLMDYDTVSADSKKAEQHRQFIDLQYVISGTELLGIGNIGVNDELAEPYDSDKECGLFKTVMGESFIRFESGMYAFLFPADIHRPGCSVDGPEKVRKVVVKIDVDLLK